MRRAKAAAGSAVFFLLAPGVVVGLIPWLLTGGWQAREPAPYWVYMQVLGGLLLVAGLFALVWAFVRFVVEGFGTPATGRRSRASGRRRSVSLRAQPDVRSGTGVYRRPGVALGPTRTAAVRWRRLAGRRGVRPLLRGTYPHPAFRRGLRDLPARCPPGGLAFVPGNPASATNQGRGDALTGDAWGVAKPNRKRGEQLQDRQRCNTLRAGAPLTRLLALFQNILYGSGGNSANS
jgi:hypothetical protein